MNLLKLIKSRVIIFDGAMGTSLAHSEDCSEICNLRNPDAVFNVHKSFVDVGCDVIETNALNANRISLGEFDLADKAREISLEAARIARKAAGKSVLVSGNIGPTNKLPSMGQISFDEMHAAYSEQIDALIEGGVDLIQIETCQDILQAKIAVIAANDIFKKIGKRLPIIVTVTIDPSGKMLLGTEIDAVLATLLPLGVDIIGLNCGLGPKGMEGAVRYLSSHSPLPILLMPNAGLPEIVDGQTKYNMGANEFSNLLKFYIEELGVEAVGGCCGTRPEHIAALVSSLKNIKPKKRKGEWKNSLSSLFNATAIKQEPRPLLIGERMNINGSKKFKDRMLTFDYDAAAMMATEQEEGGAHALDISVSYAGRSEIDDLKEILPRAAGRAHVPVSIDTTRVDAVEAALKLVPGRPIINSINLEDGGEKAKKILGLASRFGAAVVALTIDKDGMAREAKNKVQIAKKLIKLCSEFGIGEEDIFIDLLTFTLAEPKAASFGSGAETIRAIKELKKKHPKVNTSLGVSNISFGFKRSARKVLNSVFLNETVDAGLDAAIVHASQIVPIAGLDEETVKISLDLIHNRSKDALEKFISHFEDKKVDLGEIKEGVPPEEGVKLSILRGDKTKIAAFLDELVKTISAKDILNNILLPAMAEVGEKFDKGQIPLPFVLQSAEAMKAATDLLNPYFEKGEAAKKGKVILATVRGDVHDIGKNLVDIVLTNNGFDVINIGVKQPLDSILKAAEENSADVIGLSGLLVESALVMKDDLAEMAHRGVKIPVICGGAALTEKFVKEDLGEVYGNVFYAGDAFEGLRIVKELTR